MADELMRFGYAAYLGTYPSYLSQSTIADTLAPILEEVCLRRPAPTLRFRHNPSLFQCGFVHLLMHGLNPVKIGPLLYGKNPLRSDMV